MQASRILEHLVATCYKGRPVEALGGWGVWRGGGQLSNQVQAYNGNVVSCT